MGKGCWTLSTLSPISLVDCSEETGLECQISCLTSGRNHSLRVNKGSPGWDSGPRVRKAFFHLWG